MAGALAAMALVLAMALGASAASAASSTAWMQNARVWNTDLSKVVYQVQRPAVGVILSASGQSVATMESTITGSVYVTSTSGDATVVPIAILGAGQTGNDSWVVVGENTLRLQGSGRISIQMRLSAGLSWPLATLKYTVAPGAALSVVAPTSAEQAYVGRLNTMRAAAGVPPVRIDAGLTAAAAAHAAFVDGHPSVYPNYVSMHSEPGNLAGETGLWPWNRDAAFGSRYGGGSEVMSFGSHPLTQLVDETVFHRSILLDPRILAVGAADVGGVFVMDLAEGPTAYPTTVRWPVPGAGGIPTTMGGEYPSPFAVFPGATYPAGTPITWQCYGCVSPSVPVAKAVYNVHASLSANGQLVPIYLLTDQNWVDKSMVYSGIPLGSAVALLPGQPLAADTTYTVRVSASVYGRGPVSACWAFGTGGPVAPTAGCTSTTPSGSSTTTPTLTTGGGSPPSTGGSANTTTAPPSSNATTASSTTEASSETGSLRGAFLGSVAWARAHAALPAVVRAGLRMLEGTGSTVLPFRDVAQAAPWAASAIARLASAQVVEGVSAGRFDPSGHLTGEQVAVLLSRLAPVAGTFPAAAVGSVPSWAQAGVSRAMAVGWFRKATNLGGPMSRARAIRVLTRFVGWSALARMYVVQGGSWPTGLSSSTTRDAQATADLMWAAHIGLLRGINGRVAGSQPLTRAQFAVLLVRLDGLAQ